MKPFRMRQADESQQTIVFRGGEDLVTQPLAIDPGAALLALNFESGKTGGYRLVDGYEVFDGQTAPSSISDNGAKEVQRALIQAVPGSGPVRGGFVFGDKVYAFRDNLGATGCVLHEAASGGWSAVTHPARAAGGKYKAIEHNFYGTTAGNAIYGVGGANQMFKFDGTTFSHIATPEVTDEPLRIGIFNQRAFLSFDGGKIIFSAGGDPTDYTVAWGAGQYGIGQNVTGFASLPGNVMGCMGEDRSFLIAGSAVDNFALNEHSLKVGAIPDTIQRISDTFFMGPQGLTSFAATDRFGSFRDSSISEKIQPLLEQYKDKIVGTLTSRDKGQYRLLIDDTVGAEDRTLVITLGFIGNNYKERGFTHAIYPFRANCCWSGTVNGVERLFAGGTDGFVYELDSGNSFNGSSKPAILRLPFNHQKMPGAHKTFRNLFMDVTTTEAVNINYKHEIDSGDSDAGRFLAQSHSLLGSGGFWGVGRWGEFVWGASPLKQLKGRLSGSGYNIGMLIYSETTYEAPYELNSMTLRYSKRRVRRS